MDLAMLQMRRIRHNPDCIRYLWSDSTDQKGTEWLWAQMLEIRKSDLLDIFNAFILLTKLISMYAGGTQSASDQMEALPTWKRPLQTLLKINMHIYTPVALAGGQSSVTHLCEAIAHL